MIYGQAVNGWNNEWTIADVPIKIDEKFKEAFSHSQADGSQCPLEWLNTNWVKDSLFRSFFWNVTYKLVKAKYHRTDENWNNIIAWSNLMKITQHNHANPSHDEINVQMEYSAKLFVKELDELQPKIALLITNLARWAEPIFKQADIVYETITTSPYVQAIATYGNTQIIVTKRPYVGRHQLFIDEVMRDIWLKIGTSEPIVKRCWKGTRGTRAPYYGGVCRIGCLIRITLG